MHGAFADILVPNLIKEELDMSFANEKANHAIECHVSQCNNHCGCEDYCTLDKVCIGTHE